MALVKQLKLELNTVGRDLLVWIDADGADDRMIGVESSWFTFENDGETNSLHAGFTLSHSELFTLNYKNS